MDGRAVRRTNPLWRLLYNVAVPLRAHRRAWASRRQLTPVDVRSGLSGARIVAVVVAKDEAARLPYFFEYYTAAGVDHFVLIDNGSQDGTRQLALGREDTSVFDAAGSYREARFGLDWVNLIVRTHCSGKWVLHVDTDELLVVSGVADIRAACTELGRRQLRSLQTLMVDMYPSDTAQGTLVRPDQNPVEVSDQFDAVGYVDRLDSLQNVLWTYGGVRGRLYFPKDLEAGPALNKTPLVRWRRHYAFIQSTHRVWPRAVNGGRSQRLGALLHMKFTNVSIAKFTDQSVAGEHSQEYESYGAVPERMSGRQTRTYRSPEDLVNAGLLDSF